MTERDRLDMEAIGAHLSSLGLCGHSWQWLLTLWAGIQALDDWADGNSRDDIETAANWLLVDLPGNPFFQAHSATLLPLLSSAILKWASANRAEADRKPGPMSYAWRAAYWEIVLLVVALEFGAVRACELGPRVMAMYGDSYEDYLREFGG